MFWVIESCKQWDIHVPLHFLSICNSLILHLGSVINNWISNLKFLIFLKIDRKMISLASHTDRCLRKSWKRRARCTRQKASPMRNITAILAIAVVWLNSQTSHTTRSQRSAPDERNPITLLKAYPVSENCRNSNVDHGKTAKAAIWSHKIHQTQWGAPINLSCVNAP